jgi:uncharacterized membrane protein
MDDTAEFTDAAGDAHGSAVCPLCGHMLSHYSDPEESRGDGVAARIATMAGTWGFLALLLFVVAVWYAVELIWSPGFDEPGATIHYLEIMLALLAAFLAPLILLVQRRGEDRDRDRNREMLRIVINTELDAHVVRDILERRSGDAE